MKALAQWSAFVVFALVVAGCNSTVEGIAEDTERNAEKASKGVNESLEAVKVSDVAAAALTPRLKTAITSDPELNDPRNSINVDTTNDSVTLTGNVYSDSLKLKAEDIVRSEMKQSGAKQSLKNELVVKK